MKQNPMKPLPRAKLEMLAARCNVKLSPDKALLVDALTKAHRYLADNEADMQADGNWGDEEQDLLEVLTSALSTL